MFAPFCSTLISHSFVLFSLHCQYLGDWYYQQGYRVHLLLPVGYFRCLFDHSALWGHEAGTIFGDDFSDYVFILVYVNVNIGADNTQH